MSGVAHGKPAGFLYIARAAIKQPAVAGYWWVAHGKLRLTSVDDPYTALSSHPADGCGRLLGNCAWEARCVDDLYLYTAWDAILQQVVTSWQGWPTGSSLAWTSFSMQGPPFGSLLWPAAGTPGRVGHGKLAGADDL